MLFKFKVNFICHRNHRIHLGNIGGVYQAGNDGPRLRPNTTPIIMAAHRNNFYIVQLLIMKGATVSKPPSVCENNRTI